MAYTFLDLAYEVLKGTRAPLTYQSIWEAAKTAGLATKLKTSGKTPWQSLGAYLYVDVRDNQDSRFIKVGKNPARFFLKERQAEVTADSVQRLEKEEAKQTAKTPSYKERDLHPLLAHFAYANPGFNRGRSIFTKTIFHESSQKKGYNEWVHPDMVGFYLPIEDWHPDLVLEGDFGLLPVEIKYTQSPDRRSLNSLRDFVAERGCRLGLVVNNGEAPRMLDEKIAGVPFNWL